MATPDSTWRDHPFREGQLYVARKTFDASPAGQFVAGRLYRFVGVGHSHYDASTVFRFTTPPSDEPIHWWWHDSEPESKCQECFESAPDA